MNSHLDRHPSASHLSITWSESTRPCPIITWDGLVNVGEHLHVDRIFYTTHARPSVFRVPRPCLYMLCASRQPKCIACVNLAYTRCIRTLESITPDHHVVLRNNEPSQRCTVRGNTSLEILVRDHLCDARIIKLQWSHANGATSPRLLLLSYH